MTIGCLLAVGLLTIRRRLAIGSLQRSLLHVAALLTVALLRVLLLTVALLVLGPTRLVLAVIRAGEVSYMLYIHTHVSMGPNNSFKSHI